MPGFGFDDTAEPTKPMPASRVREEEIAHGATIPMPQPSSPVRPSTEGYDTWTDDYDTSESTESDIDGSDDEENFFTRRAKKKKNNEDPNHESWWSKLRRNHLIKIIVSLLALAAIAIIVIVSVSNNLNNAGNRTPMPAAGSSVSADSNDNTNGDSASSDPSNKPANNKKAPSGWQKIDPPNTDKTFEARGLVEGREAYRDPDTQAIVYVIKLSLVKEGDSTSRDLSVNLYTTKSGFDEATIGKRYKVTYSGDEKGNIIIVSLDKYEQGKADKEAKG